MKDRIVAVETEYGIDPIPPGILEIPPKIRRISTFHFTENGGRVYRDFGNHPEYAAPECAGPVAATLYDAAGDKLMHEIFRGSKYKIHKLNRDEENNYFGSHENYSVHNEFAANMTWCDYIVRFLAPFLATRQIFAGSGYYGNGEFLISQRADTIQTLRSYDTMTSNTRAIFNEKYEPHSTKFLRLHLILGDSNMCEYASVLKLATTCMILDLAEEHFDVPLALKDPVEALHDISRFKWDVMLEDGRTINAVDIQRHYLDMARRLYGNDLPARRYLDEWEGVLDALKEDPRLLAGELEWPTKKAFLEGLDEEDRFDAHLRWHDIDPEKSLYHELARQRLVRRCFDDRRIEHAASNPPRDTRARFRGEFIRSLPKNTKNISMDWEYIGDFRMEDPFDDYGGHDGEMDRLLKELSI